MPLRLVEPVEKMINKDTRYRPTAHHFSLVRFTLAHKFNEEFNKTMCLKKYLKNQCDV